MTDDETDEMTQNEGEIGDEVSVKADDWHFEVRCSNGAQFCVNLIDKSCTCRSWSLSGIPCNHALSVKGSIEDFVSECYTVGVNNSLNQQASSLNPTVFTQEIPTQQSQTRFMPTPQLHVPGPSMYDQLMGTNMPQPSRATHGPIIRGPAAFTGERPLFSAGSSITSVSAASVVVVDQGKKFMVLNRQDKAKK
ncbi:FAR1-related sequence 2 [Striga asiatica]|uniref:FAR1-related sequence 2 n=1 Tax=Striga asiatica TaxID=4170 RepID=A0A5A7QAR9_STRAF|nr:FAR1-related sequence 2 [Striga asiatica]